ncbi:hypothetical protein GQ651_01525 [Alphaproteobacteria bacterium GH1-50]|uniref:Uncharacterized protein n=1 Tax=Kangsaoukella pontilimi TaxID=2691042 RepID=A0A7C9MY44_9RHOB|nr:hypothetical protein [Kangsaoukella pontilimi]MXQ06518.1 hypothetical protein [Kangsaoukella pontilimi]
MPLVAAPGPVLGGHLAGDGALMAEPFQGAGLTSRGAPFSFGADTDAPWHGQSFRAGRPLWSECPSRPCLPATARPMMPGFPSGEGPPPGLSKTDIGVVPLPGALTVYAAALSAMGVGIARRRRLKRPIRPRK